MNIRSSADTAVALAERFKPDTVLIEDASTGIALAQELNDVLGSVQSSRSQSIAIRSDGSMFSKASSTPVVWFFRGDASFLPELETELLSFPQGKTDDQVDSITQALAYQDLGFDASYSWVMGKPRKPSL